MSIDTITYQKIYPKFQAEGFAAQFAFPYALKICKGTGYDIGCMKQEWSFPGSIAIDKNFNDQWDANHLPYSGVDYIFSSHCLEHIENWVSTLDYWTETLKDQGVLFLYLPHPDQIYWRPWHNRKHLHSFTIQIIKDYMLDRGYINIFNSERDLNYSFMIIGEKGRG
jgi:predicted SAM-dependent methyltransferase